MPNLIALVSIAVTIIVALLGATWHLSNKIGDVRVAVATLAGNVDAQAERVDTLWTRCFGPHGQRPCRVRGSLQQVEQ